MILIAKETMAQRHITFNQGKPYKAHIYDGRPDAYGHTISSSEKLYMIFNHKKQVTIIDLETIKRNFVIFTK